MKNIYGFPKIQLISSTVACIALTTTAIAYAPSANAAAIRSGFNANTLAANDDSSTGLVPIGFDVNLGGVTTNELFVNNNGNVTFDSSLSTFTPFDIVTTDRDIIAPFFADVDTANSSPVTYGSGTVDDRDAFGVNWVDVGHYDDATTPNSFQLVLIDRSDLEAGAFDFEFNYDEINWETGDFSGGTNGLGGDSARAGFAYGDNGNRTAFELEGSAVNGAFLDGGINSLVDGSFNSDTNGRYLFEVRDGAVIGATTPEPSALLGSICVLGLSLLKKKKTI